MLQKFLTVTNCEESRKALIEHRIFIGQNTVLEGVCKLGEAVTIGENVLIGNGSTVGGHTVIEDNVKIGGNCFIGEGSFIGKGIVLSDNVSVPDRTFIGMERALVDKSVDFSATFSYSNGKIESIFGDDKVLMYDPDIDQDYETSISFKEFIKKTKIRQRIKILEENRRKDFLKNVSLFIGALKKVISKKSS